MAGDAAVAGGDGVAIPLEWWASPEPTVARIGATTVRDQGAETGWSQRSDDLERIAALGVSAMRLPVLWEHVAPRAPHERDFGAARARVERAFALGVEPIVTLLHHGSGPAYTDLLDPHFPALFADYAEAAARALPGVRRWTPINEPLTTARFATLYGVWYPNRRDEPAFGRALLHQMRAVAGAMERIRAHVPDARLVFTEDLQGFAGAGDGVAEYVAFLRERRWLSVELLAGRVDRAHPLYGYLVDRCLVAPDELAGFVARPVVPDLVAFNHYPHSERYLFRARDGSVGDVPAVYVAERWSPRAGPLLGAAAARLGLPLALGEVHIDAPAPERVRWLEQHVEDVVALGAQGVDVRAVGAWAAFGMVDWHSLLRRRDGASEDGIYTFAGPQGIPQPTAVAHALRALVRGEPVGALGRSGWWERPRRLRAPEELWAFARAGRPEGHHVRETERAPT